jgi:hypothetical protein
MEMCKRLAKDETHIKIWFFKFLMSPANSYNWNIPLPTSAENRECTVYTNSRIVSSQGNKNSC